MAKVDKNIRLISMPSIFWAKTCTPREGKCELSEEAGTLVTYDLEGSDSEPSLDHVLLVSPQVQQYLDGGKFEAESLRFGKCGVEH